MTAPAGFLDFFVLEAGDYIEQLDALMLAAGNVGPDLEALQRSARALRGSATMAKLPAFAEMAAGIERVGHGLRERRDALGARARAARSSRPSTTASCSCATSARGVRPTRRAPGPGSTS